MGWRKKPQIPKSAQAQDKYSYQQVLPKLQDEKAAAKLRLVVGTICAATTLAFGWLILHYGFRIFERHWLLVILGVALLLILVTLGWLLGIKIALRAENVRLERYFILHQSYLEDLAEVEEARNALMKAEQDLAKVEQSLDQLIASTHNRPLLIAGFAAIGSALKGAKQLEFKSNQSLTDLTDHAVHQHSQNVQHKESTLRSSEPPTTNDWLHPTSTTPVESTDWDKQ
jgi:hypothetical protein